MHDHLLLCKVVARTLLGGGIATRVEAITTSNKKLLVTSSYLLLVARCKSGSCWISLDPFWGGLSCNQAAPAAEAKKPSAAIPGGGTRVNDECSNMDSLGTRTV